MEKKLFLACVLWLVLLCAYPQIQSTTIGGYWHDPGTWIGGIVPGENDDVVINGPVVQVYTSGYTILPVHCHNLVISASGSLRNGSYGGGYGEFPVYVHGNAINNGSVGNGPDDVLKIILYGDLSNYNYWKPVETEFAFSANHNLSLADNMTFGSKIVVTGSASLTALTDMVFTCDWYSDGYHNHSHLMLNGQIFNLDNRTIEMRNCLVNSGVLSGDFEIKGTFTVGYDVSDTLKFVGNVLVTDTLMANSYGGGYGIYNLCIDGNLTNNGVVKDNMDADAVLNDDDLCILTTGDIINNGLWSCKYVKLTGSNTQFVSQATGRYFDSFFYDLNASGNTQALSDITISKDFNLNTASLEMDGNVLTLGGWLKDGIIMNARLRNGFLSNVTSKGDLFILGVVTIGNNNVFSGSVTVTDTIQSMEYGGGSTTFTLKIDGNLVNHGLIRNINTGDKLSLEISGNIDNQGIWQNSFTKFTGLLDQTIQQAAGTRFQSDFTDTDTSGVVSALSDIRIDGSFNLQRCAIQMNHHEINISGALYNGNIFSAAVKNATLSDITAFGNTEIRGIVVIDDGNVFNGNLLVTDTLQSQMYGGGSHLYKLYNYGDVENNGVIRDEPQQDENFALYIQGDIINKGRWTNYRNYQLYYLNDNIHTTSCFNTGIGSWLFNGSTITGSGANSFAMVSGGGVQTVAPGQSYEVTVKFVPVGNDFSALLTVGSSEIGSLDNIYLIGYDQNTTVGLDDQLTYPWYENQFFVQNFPNPFSTNTSINYKLQVSSKVDLTLYDLSGHEVVKLCRCEKEAGAHRIDLDGSFLPAGVYLLKATINERTYTLKMVKL